MTARSSFAAHRRRPIAAIRRLPRARPGLRAPIGMRVFLHRAVSTPSCADRAVPGVAKPRRILFIAGQSQVALPTPRRRRYAIDNASAAKILRRPPELDVASRGRANGCRHPYRHNPQIPPAIFAATQNLAATPGQEEKGKRLIAELEARGETIGENSRENHSVRL